MDALNSKRLVFPESLDETKIDGSLQMILDGIDLCRLFQDQRLTRVRHPLLEERMGKDTALNAEIHNLITDIVRLFTSSTLGSLDQKEKHISLIEGILLDNANDPEKMTANLDTLKDMVTQLASLNPEGNEIEIEELISGQLRQKLTMPTAIQDMVLYPPVTIASLTNSKQEALKTLESTRSHLIAALESTYGVGPRELLDELLTESAAARAYFEKEGA